MIYTCTLNPSIDYVMNVDQFQAGTLNRSSETYYYPGGKGINVSRVMGALGTQTTALGYIGGFTGDFIKSALEENNISHQFIEIEGNTRVNVKLKSADETEINGPGPSITQEQQDRLLEQVEHMTKEDLLVIAGSVPSTLPEDFYVTIANLCEEREVKLIADTSGKALNQIVGSPLFLLKPNHHELGELFNTTIETKEQAATYAHKLVHQGVKHVIVSMGGEGAVYVGEKQQLFANVPKGEVKNSVGAGDSVVAAFTAKVQQSESIEEAFRYAVAAGSATAFQTDLCNKEDVEELVPSIHVSSVKGG
ncbi:1-phosphofructokinase [Halobacillus locisalis]|uniref:Tagatose-6-phosphate kinase n=1 Tax=Halobacillus locisalis TaxID=220753 RepID=A0A838CUR2_9BACI|nr:1-phosphofructokinase [Halobacillus locisalis]MBA2175648.1 1-phosphofructokinase [Halobacillus locisalis]